MRAVPKLVGGLALGLLGLFSSAAPAGTVTAKFTGIDQTVFTVTVHNSAGTFNEAGGGGKFYWDGSAAAGGGGASNAPGFQGTFFTFCTDIKDNIGLGNVYTYNLGSLSDAPILNGGGAGVNTDLTGGMGADKANILQLLFGQHLADVTNVATAGAFQLAIWEVVYDSLPLNGLNQIDFSLYDVASFAPPLGDATNGFKVSGGANSTMISTANSWLNTLDVNGAKLSLGAITSNTYQDQIVVVPFPSAVTAGFGLLSLLLVARWYRTQHQDRLASIL